MVNKLKRRRPQQRQEQQLELEYIDNDNHKQMIDISPNWANRLLEAKHLPFPISLKWLRWLYEISSPSRCIVGEAYGYSSSYEKTCRECCIIGNRFSLYLTFRLEEKLQENKLHFVKHWNNKHSTPIYSSPMNQSKISNIFPHAVK